MGLRVPRSQPAPPDAPVSLSQWFVGIDRGSEHHQVCVLDRDRTVVGERVVDHDGARLAQLAPWLWTVWKGRPQEVAVAIAVPRGAMVEGLLERGLPVFAMNPQQLDRCRERYSMAGATDDRRDAFVLADALRTDQPSLSRLRLDDPPFILLRRLSRAEETVLEDFLRTVHRFREELHGVSPQMLQLC